MQIRKITHGFVIQVFDTEKEKWVDQEFVASSGETEYDDCEGNPLDEDEAEEMIGDADLPLEMIQPEKM